MAASTDDGALARARAMSAPSRATIHRLISEADHPSTIADLATATGLHRTAVRMHLRQLIDAGLVEELTLAPSGRGRPAKGFRPVDDQPYRTIAGWLAEAVRTGRSAREVGRSAGERLAVADGDPIDCLLAEATRLGFDPQLESSSPGAAVDIVLRTCPFADLAADDPATICDLHLGLAEGIVNVTGGAVVEGLQVHDPHRGGCRLQLRR